jgi:hypothetical protein
MRLTLRATVFVLLAMAWALTLLSLAQAVAAPASDAPLSSAEAARMVDKQVTVELTVMSTGTNPAGFVELHSGRTWQEGSFFVRFPPTAQEKCRKLGIVDVRNQFLGKTVRVTGTVESLDFGAFGPHSFITAEATQPVYAVREYPEVTIAAINAETKKIIVSLPEGGGRAFNVSPKTWIIKDDDEATFAD